VSADFHSHLCSWELKERQVARTNEKVPQWVQVRRRDDLLWCCCSLVVQAEMAELIGATIPIAGDEQPETEEKTNLTK